VHLTNGVAADLAAYDEVAAAVPDARIAVDVHCSYSRADALRLARGLDARGAWFIESALAPEDLAGHAALAAAVDTPIAVGEAFRHRFEAAEWVRRDAVDMLQPQSGLPRTDVVRS
jgi:D-galactarolactone cycloisomerase